MSDKNRFHLLEEKAATILMPLAPGRKVNKTWVTERIGESTELSTMRDRMIELQRSFLPRFAIATKREAEGVVASQLLACLRVKMSQAADVARYNAGLLRARRDRSSDKPRDKARRRLCGLRRRVTEWRCEKDRIFGVLKFLEAELRDQRLMGGSYEREVKASVKSKNKRLARIDRMLQAANAELCAAT